VAELQLDHVSKVFPDGTRAVDAVSLDIGDGEFVVLVGPSGCGKTTLLRMIAGLEDVTEGEVLIAGRAVNRVAPKDRDLAMVFQSYALYPHLTVFDNIAFPLKLRRTPKRDIRPRVERAARLLGLEQLLDRKPRNLSGGQRQRVAMGRAIVREPAAFLMDEPLSNLDAKLRVQTRSEILRLQHELRVTTVYVTHDQVEAMTMGDRVAVMRRGRLEQVDHPQVLYDRAVNMFVGAFIGSPAMNLLEGTVEKRADAIVIHVGDQEIALGTEVLAFHPELPQYDGRHVVVGIRPEDLEDGTIDTERIDRGTLSGRVDLLEALGSEVQVHLLVDARVVIEEEALDTAAEATSEHHVVARFSPRTRAREGDIVQAVFDLAALYFFDPEDGLAIGQREGAAGAWEPADNEERNMT
jgi:multiple sugar transport system ATP-binding protein